MSKIVANNTFYSSYNLDEIDKLNKYLKYFDNLFQPIYKLQINDKLGIEPYDDEINTTYFTYTKMNFKFYYDPSSYYQFLVRKIYQQNRHDIMEKLKILIDNYINFYNKFRNVKQMYGKEELRSFNDKFLKINDKFLKINDKFLKINDKLSSGLNNLRETYQDNKVDEKLNKFMVDLSPFTQTMPSP
jgi:hypothetical protein